MVDILSDLKNKEVELDTLVQSTQSQLFLYQQELEKVKKAIEIIQPKEKEQPLHMRFQPEDLLDWLLKQKIKIPTEAKKNVETFIKEMSEIVTKDDIQKCVKDLETKISDFGKDAYKNIVVPVSKDLSDMAEKMFSENDKPLFNYDDKMFSKRELISNLLENEVLNIKYKRIRDGKVKTFLATCVYKEKALYNGLSKNDFLIKLYNGIINSSSENNLKYANDYNKLITKDKDSDTNIYFFDLGDNIFKKININNIIEISIVTEKTMKLMGK